VGEVAMFFAISNFTTVDRAALFAARVAVGAIAGSSDGGIWGVSDPLCHPPDPVPALSGGVAHAPVACRCRPAEPRFVHDTAECTADVVGHSRIDFIDENTAVRFVPEIAFI
jgi:hypothetical protein